MVCCSYQAVPAVLTGASWTALHSICGAHSYKSEAGLPFMHLVRHQSSVADSGCIRRRLRRRNGRLQVFLGSGEALTTRVYKRAPPCASGAAGVFLVAHGGDAVVSAGEAFTMNSIWANV